MTHKYTLLFLGLSLALGACEEDFDAYNDIKGLRVLAHASDKPQLPPNESATLSALVTEDADYAWSWCPFPGPAESGYACALTHADVQAFADEVLATPVVIPDFDLGHQENCLLGGKNRLAAPGNSVTG